MKYAPIGNTTSPVVESREGTVHTDSSLSNFETYYCRLANRQTNVEDVTYVESTVATIPNGRKGSKKAGALNSLKASSIGNCLSDKVRHILHIWVLGAQTREAQSEGDV